MRPQFSCCYNEPGVFMAFEETAEELAKKVSSLGFDPPCETRSRTSWTPLKAVFVSSLGLVFLAGLPHGHCTEPSRRPVDQCLRKSLEWKCPDVKVSVPVSVYFQNERTSQPAPVIVYVMHHGYPRVGQEPDVSILGYYLRQHYLVVTVDFAGVGNAVSPIFDFDLLALQQAIYGYKTESLLAGTGLDPLNEYCWFLPAGCRLARDVEFFDLAKHGAYGTKEKVLAVWNSVIRKKFKAPLLRDPEAMTTRDGLPLNYKLYLDVIYPSQPSRKLPLFAYLSTQSIRTRCTRNDVISGPHIFGFAMRGYVTAIVDHCWNPLARHWAYGYFDGPYTLDPWNGLKANTAAIRYLRAHADVYGIDTNLVCAMGYSKASYGVTRLSDPNHESQEEDAKFAGFPAGSPEPQPWPGFSSRITAGYQAVGGGTRKPQYVTSRQVPTITACGKFDKFKFWPIFPALVQVYESHDVNHLAIWMHELAHEPPHGYDPWHDRDRYALLTTFFDQYLKPRENPAPVVLYTYPTNNRADVDLQGRSQAIPDLKLLPADAQQYVALKEPITVHFAPPVDARGVIGGGIKVMRQSDGAPVPGTWSASRGSTYFKFLPAAELAPQTQYRVVVTTAVKGENGVALAAERSILFRTTEVPQ